VLKIAVTLCYFGGKNVQKVGIIYAKDDKYVILMHKDIYYRNK
jgi:hypothetical protein